MNLEQLRKQAKELVKAARAGDEDALARLGGREPRLASAQLALAREQGYPSWPALVHALEADAEAFLRAATSERRERAERLLAARPELERDPWVALTLGRGWEGDPNEPGGPLGWAPVLYVSHSVYRPAGLLRELLERGADPNAVFVNEYGPMSALYGAAGVVHDPELTRILLAAGADPNDNESVYHSCEAESPECLRLLLEHGAVVPGTYALAHALDYERPEHLRLLFEHGADPNEGAVLYHAVIRGRDGETVRALVEHGTQPDPAAYRAAVRRGSRDQVEALERLGIVDELTEVDRALAAIAAGERPGSLPELDRDAEAGVIQLAMADRLDLVVDLLGPGFAGSDGGPVGTLLHHAAWRGRPDLVARLLERGADVDARVETDYATPLGWAVVGSAYAPVEGDPFYPSGADHVAVAELLVAAGAKLEPHFEEMAEGPLLEWLVARR